MENKRNLAEVLGSLQNGDPITDEELWRLNRTVTHVAALTADLGSSFHLASYYAAQLQQSTGAMIRTRGTI